MSTSVVVRERQLVVVVVDLARFTQSVAGLSLQEVALLVDAFYRAAEEVIRGHGGRVVKFVGDGCLAVFEPDDVLRALDALDDLRARVVDLAGARNLSVELGANVHLSTVAEGELGEPSAYEVVGMGVIHAFRMGGGPGTRLSEPVYRRLPSNRRSSWHRHQPPATYSRAD